MSRHADRPAACAARPREAGFVLVTALVLVTLTLGITFGYARHALTASASSRASIHALDAERAAWSGLAYGCQTLRSGSPTNSTTVTAGDAVAAVRFQQLAPARHALSVEARTAAAATALRAEASLLPASGPRPPRLTAEAARALLASDALVPVRETARYRDVVLDAILLLEPGATLTLQDVVLTGGIVDRQAIDGTPAASRIVLEGGVRIAPAAILQGAAIVAPGADVSVAGDGTLEADGMVVARALSAFGGGFQAGALVTTEPPLLSAAFARPGAGRGPQAWSPIVEPTAHAFADLAFPRSDVPEPERARIAGFAFPAPRRGPARAAH